MKILIAKEKYGDRYFDASTNDALANSCLYLLKTRLEEGYWGYEPEKPDSTDILSMEEIATLPEKYRKEEEKNRKYYDAALAYYEDDLIWFNEVKKCIAEKTLALNKRGLPIAYELLRRRSNCEYEGIELETVETVTI